jgi:alpha-mannosidase
VEGRIQGYDYTLGLLNDSTYSYDCLNGLLRTILIRSAPYTWNSVPDRSTPDAAMPKDNINAWQDQGRQERTLWLVGRRGKCAEQCFDKLSNELQMQTEYVMDSKHHGTECWERSFLEITPATVPVLSMKPAEDSTGAIIVRVQERVGRQTSVRLQSSLLRLSSDITLLPWEIKTVRIETSKQHKTAVSAVSAIEA